MKLERALFIDKDYFESVDIQEQEMKVMSGSTSHELAIAAARIVVSPR